MNEASPNQDGATAASISARARANTNRYWREVDVIARNLAVHAGIQLSRATIGNKLRSDPLVKHNWKLLSTQPTTTLPTHELQQLTYLYEIIEHAIQNQRSPTETAHILGYTIAADHKTLSAYEHRRVSGSIHTATGFNITVGDQAGNTSAIESVNTIQLYEHLRLAINFIIQVGNPDRARMLLNAAVEVTKYITEV